MTSIKQNDTPDVLPDFRNLGVVARILVAVNVMALAAALYSATGWMHARDRFVEAAALVEPMLLSILLVLYIVAPRLQRLNYLAGCAAVLAVALLFALATHSFWARSEVLASGLGRALALTALAVVLLLGYFRLRARAYSPALAEARLQALQARIRPHFLFNSLNAVLSVIRRDPRRAERALEDLADLFRTLMSDARQFVRLADEIALLERYASLEQLRLGDRLRVAWEIDAAPSDALLPPLVLQPLLENAVYHGIEPGTGVGEVLVHVERRGDRVLARIENPYHREHQHRAGNRMALDNIRERLMLFFDAEARIETGVVNDRFRVEIEIPYRTERGAAPEAV